MAGIDLEELALRSIDQYARVETRLGGVEQTLQHIRSDNAQLLRDFNEALNTLADMQRQLINNTDDHRILHNRVDDVKDELDEVKESIASIKTTCATNRHHRAQLAHIEELIKQLEFAAKVFGYRLFGVPAWLIVLSMVIMGSIIDIVKHRDLMTLILGVIK